jgi:Inactive homolog of metal-dependent proteases, putative molecular chaperone
MTLTLLIQASNGVPSLALGRGDEIVFDSAAEETLSGSRDYRLMLETGLAAIGSDLSEITLIACDIGPGGLGVTRTAAAFANGLGFARSIPVLPLPAFELLGAEVARDKPVAILRRAARPHVHFGIYADGKLALYEHCTEQNTLDQLSDMEDYDLAGNIEVAGHGAPVTNKATMGTMLRLALSAPTPGPESRAWPIVEVLE